VRCLAQVLVPHDPWAFSADSPLGIVFAAAVTPQDVSGVSGLSPATIKSVYGLSTSSTAGSGETVAVVDAYHDPTAESNLNTFSAQFGLPACTGSCFTQVDEDGNTNYPAVNPNWALEISLDIEWVHAIAPGADILLVEADSTSYSDMMAAEVYAGAHAIYVVNTWGGAEFSGETAYDSYFSDPGVGYFVAAGDRPSVLEYPAASPNVISVGGTQLNLSASGALESETAWSNGGGGCSAYERASYGQAAFAPYQAVGCNGARAVPDVSADADQASGVAVYDSTPILGSSGWWTSGGTSLATPIWAAAAADSGSPVTPSTIYSPSSTIPFRLITSGSNGHPALAGFNLASGRGSLNGPLVASEPIVANEPTTGSSAGVAAPWSTA
jgi:subtilase family serine protease